MNFILPISYIIKIRVEYERKGENEHALRDDKPISLSSEEHICIVHRIRRNWRNNCGAAMTHAIGQERASPKARHSLSGPNIIASHGLCDRKTQALDD